ncbi:chromosomal replication initiator protein DnaA [Gemella sp. GH3]|uniref:chromosomal replication initiator protein DnaA n=1 Tax=unclassified Gemella TaxID=2624949 RepID=UPI0015CFB38E|nr:MULTISPECIES: chromosomal replication initiator protein DnaA [unclassified Gemella]MBF0714252.1 chromosomal replication initiator protein DnaA [Gemella sp. GH3.1]NYS51204.1 chromosomal replication initiator protein DnaA [Gemella sp. GH3]
MSNNNFIWENILKNIKDEVSPEVYEGWLHNSYTDNVDLKNKTITIICSNSFLSDLFKNVYDEKFKSIIKNLMNVDFSFYYNYLDEEKVIEDNRKKEEDNNSAGQLIMNNFLAKEKPSGSQNFFQAQSFPLDEYKSPVKKAQLSSSKNNPSLNKNFTFDNFIVGEGNQYAVTLARTVASYPGESSPAFIYGGVGLGKTHLLHAIGNELEEHNPDFKIKCISSEKFLNDFMRLIQPGSKSNFSNDEFNRIYRNVDALLIDDIQFLSGKQETLKNFFHVFNELQENQKQIVLISDRPPHLLDGIEDRLVSRFESGVTADITPPEYETIATILKLKCGEASISIDESIVAYISGHIHQNTNRNIRELEGIVKELKFMVPKNEKITMEMVERIVKKRINTTKKTIEPSNIINTVASFYNISVDDIYSPKRNKEIANARQIAIYLCRELTDLSLPAIGKIFKKDHSSIFYANNKVVTLKEENEDVATDIENIKNKIKNI